MLQLSKGGDLHFTKLNGAGHNPRVAADFPGETGFSVRQKQQDHVNKLARKAVGVFPCSPNPALARREEFPYVKLKPLVPKVGTDVTYVFLVSGIKLCSWNRLRIPEV